MDKLLTFLEQRFKKPKLWSYIRDFLRRCKEDNVSATGAQLAYYLVLAFFPFLIFLLTLMPLTPLADQDILASLLQVMPESAADIVGPVVEDVLNNRSGTLLSTALILTLWSASSGMNNLLSAMDIAFDVDNKRNFIVKRLISLLFTLVLVLMIFITLASQVFGEVIVSYLSSTALSSGVVEGTWSLVRNLIPFVVMVLGFSLLYRYGPGFPKEEILSFKEALIGGVVAAAGWTLISQGFAFYVSNFANYSNTYGSIGGLIILLIWLYISSLVIMLGAEATASYISVFKGGVTEQNETIAPA